jgi:eukaryotic-like serine/threonine-protein kinase
MDQYIGKMLDNRYEILECIGTGGMAVVYKARCHRLNRLVAVKILKPELASDAEFRRRFHDESQAVAMLSHVNIVTVYDVSHSEGLDYIVMELVDGMTLKQYMQKRGAPLNWREALHFITQIVRALGHAHSRGIIHRDIKPQNILVLRDGSVKVTDFGIARITSAAQATLTQEALGSVHYISPEQARGSHIDGRSDLYSAGVVLYEMLTGRLPFEGETPVSVAIQHINSIPIPPRDLNPGIPPALEAITLKAMAPKVEDRYASADEMLDDLEEFRKNPDVVPEHAREVEALLDEPTRVVPVADIKQEAEAQRSHRGQSHETPGNRDDSSYRRPARPQRQPAEDDYDDEEEEPRRRSVPPILIAILAILVFAGGMFFFIYNFFIKGMTTTPKDLEVPDLSPYTLSQLQEDTSLYEGFTLKVEYQESDEHEENTVIEQNPKAGESAREGRVITVVISQASETIIVPELENKYGISAMNELTKLGLVPEPEYENDDEITADYVIRTSPQAGESLTKGQTVKVVISMGPKTEMVTVPPFLNMDINQARSAAEMYGLVVEKVEEFPSDEYDAGKVMFQSIASGEQVEKGTKISFQISTGPAEEPSASPEPSESADPQPSGTAAVTTQKTIEINLDDYISKETIHLVVKVGGTVNFDNMVNTILGTQTVQITGSGKQTVEIIVDGVTVETRTVDFTA